MVMAGTIWTAVAHVITGVIEVGVLSLAWSTTQLGWVAGPLVIVIFAAITQVSTLLVCYFYKSSDPVHGPTRNTSFIEVVKFYLGRFVFHFYGVF
ncbi:probable amino acid permease 7 [Phtheirospermum japonicum]|uniref:Probable amino acid permease 7 n=1 Tax=Phtheirospermum japonicum TaxID=374723 RepID=A0A830BR99_9LAMI|nr:probable amino acid permease 7 [Phtheirospermum japonicum]